MSYIINLNFEEFLEDYLERGITLREIMVKHKLNYAQISKILDRYNIPKRSRQLSIDGATRQRMNECDTKNQDILRKYQSK